MQARTPVLSCPGPERWDRPFHRKRPGLTRGAGRHKGDAVILITDDLTPIRRAARPPQAAGRLFRAGGGAFRQFLVEQALVEFGHRLTLEFVAFVEKGQAEGIAHIVEDARVLCP